MDVAVKPRIGGTQRQCRMEMTGFVEDSVMQSHGCWSGKIATSCVAYEKVPQVLEYLLCGGQYTVAQLQSQIGAAATYEDDAITGV
jgi:hypothetical protein